MFNGLCQPVFSIYSEMKKALLSERLKRQLLSFLIPLPLFLPSVQQPDNDLFHLLRGVRFGKIFLELIRLNGQVAFLRLFFLRHDRQHTVPV